MRLEHEYVSDRAVALSVRGAKLTGRLLAKAMTSFLRNRKRAHDAPKPGNQSVKKITRSLGGMDNNIEVMGRIRSFERIARKYRVSYHITQERDVSPPKYTVYFNSRQNGSLTAAFKEYTALMLGKERENKPSLLKRLAKYQELAKTAAAPVRNRDRGEREL